MHNIEFEEERAKNRVGGEKNDFFVFFGVYLVFLYLFLVGGGGEKQL